MTSVLIGPRIENPSSDTEAVASSGYFNIRPSKAYVSGGQWVQPVWPANPVKLDGTVKTVLLDPLADTPYELFVSIPNGRGKSYEFTEFRIVAGAGPVAWETLVQVDGPGGGAVLTDVVDARLDALESSFGGVSGGASTLASITNMSPFARLLNTDTTAAAMQTRLGVPPTASPTFTGTLTAANPTFTGTVTIPDGALVIADTSGLQTALDAKAPLASPALTGTPTAPTPTAGDNDTSIATTAFVATAVSGVIAGGGGAPLNSPAFTGNPTAPTPTAGDNDTSIATTAFVSAAVTTAVTLASNNVVIPNAVVGTARNHPVSGAALPAAPACCVTWVTVGLIAAPTAFDANGDIWFNKEA